MFDGFTRGTQRPLAVWAHVFVLTLSAPAIGQKEGDDHANESLAAAVIREVETQIILNEPALSALRWKAEVRGSEARTEATRSMESLEFQGKTLCSAESKVYIPSSLQVGHSDEFLSRGPGMMGRFETRGGLLLHSGNRRFVLRNPTLVPSLDTEWAISDGVSDDVPAKSVFLIRDKQIAVHSGTKRLRISGELVISPWLAASLSDSTAAGQTIGRLRMDAELDLNEATRAINREENGPMGFSTESDPIVTPATVGPDVIVANLYQVANFGVVGPTAALSIGTDSCNIGNQNLDWEDDTNRHPVIAQHLYRLKNGRFEQIGLSWLKHGFYATNGATCFADCHGTNGTELGVHCSDPYSANLNGSQGNLGPRYQVNAFTGIFPYPPANPAYSGILARRLQVKVNDLDHSMNQGAEYFLEGHYVTLDDAAAGNGENNVSYRPAIVSGAGSSVFVQIGSPTVQQDPAILAWKREDPAVVETNIRVPGEGLMILAAKTTQLAGNLWSYEYALYNMNSHRSAGSFRVPIDPTSTLQNIGFHDVDYHSGEPFSGADWPSSSSGVSLTWSTQTYAQNANGNALRWGTLYNFRFETDAPPQSTVIRVGLFRPGNPEFVDAISIGPATNTEDCNLNDVADSIDILNGTSEDCDGDIVPDECEAFAAQTIQVATGLNQPIHAASPPGDSTRLFIAENGGRIRLLKAGAVLGTPFLDLSSLIDPSGDGLLGLAFDPDYATNKRFFVNYVNSAGDVVIARYLATANPDIANPASATILKTIGQDGSGRNGGGLQFGPDGKLYVGMGDGGAGSDDPHLRAQDSGTLLGKLLRLDVNAPPNYIPADNPFTSPGLPLDEIWALGLGHPRTFSFDRETGELYLADVGGMARDEINVQPAGSNGGENYGWRCMEGSTCTGLSGCTCTNPTLVPPVFSYSRAAIECAVSGGYVYRGCAMPNLRGTYFHADFCSGTIRSFRLVNGVVTDERDRTAELTPVQGPIGSIVSFAEDATGELYIVSRDGDVYQIVPRDVPPDVCGNGVTEPGETCDDGNTAGGDGCDSSCQIEPGLVNDSCALALPVSEGVFPFDSSDATTDGPNEPAACNFNGYTQVGSDIWYCYTPSCTGTATVSLCGSSFDTKVAVYGGCGCPAGPSAIACNDNSCGSSSSVTVSVSACAPYMVRVGGRSGLAGTGNLSISCNPDPVINDCNGNGIEDLADIGCGSSTDGNSNSVPDECETDGDPILGGRLYDGWWTEVGAPEPLSDHPLWAYRQDIVSNPATGSATWRCRECHGWDYRGVDGQYSSGPHRTGIPGVLGTNLSAEDLFNLIKEPPNNGGGAGVLNGHNYGSVLPDTRVNDLVAFVLSGAIDNSFIEPNGDFSGNPTIGQTNYMSGGTVPCMTCHGNNGTAINFGTFENPRYLGTVSVEDPWEMLHKIRFGQPAAPMPSWLAGGGENQGAADIGRYIQMNFPTECVEDGQCDDVVDCTVDTCDGTGRCAFIAEDELCPQDGVFCNGPEVCDPKAGCVSIGNPCADVCNESDLCGCLPPAVTAPGGRYLTLTAQSSIASTPIRFAIVPSCPNGIMRWIDEPDPVTRVAQLVDLVDAAELTSAEWGGPVHVTGLDIVPQTTYHVYTECGRDDLPFFTTAVTVTTQQWGDTVGTFSGGAFTPPNGVENFYDINAVVAGFRALPSAPPLPVLDLFGCVPDQRVNFLDIAGAVDGFRGYTYSGASLCPSPCD